MPTKRTVIRTVMVFGWVAVCGLALAFVPVFRAPGHATELEIRFAASGDSERAAIELAGLSDRQLRRLRRGADRPDEIFVVHVAESVPGGPPIVGRYAIGPRELRFRPAFPWQPGVSYRATGRAETAVRSTGSRGEGRARSVTALYTPPPVVSGAPEVVAIYPTDAVVPENLLRLYISFSQPMARGNLFEHVRLVDEDDQEIEGAFLRIGHEFWSRDQRRVMVMLDPGRIKRGLAPHVEAGAPLAEHRRFRLVIDRGVRNAAGTPLTAPVERTFTVAGPDRVQPDVARWSIATPRGATHETLSVDFASPLDYALLRRMIAVVDDTDTPIAGSVRVVEGERGWRFVPDDPWRSGSYRLVVDRDLEDMAGNSLEDLFDIDVASGERHAAGEPTVEIPFVVAESR